MPKITGPLFSLAASGSFGDRLTFLHTKRGPVLKRKSAPTGAPSHAQAVRRVLYQLCAAGWSALSPPQKAAWLPAAAARRITPFNAYMADALRAGGPIVAPPPPDVWHLYPVLDVEPIGFAPIGAPTIWQALSTPGDATYIQGTSDGVTVALRPIADPGLTTGHAVRFRAAASAGWLAVALMQDAVTIASKYYYGAFPATPTDDAFTLTPAEAANITDYAALSLTLTGLIGVTTFYSAELQIDTGPPAP